MQVAARSNSARSYLAAGVALVGAGAIAVSPVAPPLPDVHVPAVSTASVNLSAAVDPFEAYVQLITNTVNNVGTLIGTEIADPFPILQQIVANQITSGQGVFAGLQQAGEALGQQLDPSNPYGIPAQLQLAFTQLFAGDINGAVGTAWSALLSPVLVAGLPLLEPITNAVKQPVQNLLNVINDPLAVLIPVLGALNTVYPAVLVSGNVGQNMVDAIKAGDPLGFVNAVIAGPGQIADAFLNGAEAAGGGGLLGPSLGLLSALRQARDAIAKDIAPPAALTAAVAQLSAAPKAPAKVVTLDVAPAPAEQTSTAPTESTPSGSAAAGSAVTDSPAGNGAKTASSDKAASTATPTRANRLKQTQDGVKGAVKNITDGLKKAGEGLTGKKTASKSGGQSNSTGSGEGGNSSGGSGSHNAA
ncbi:hypothetical protein A5784_11675 [Mycobacterium sp. 852013-50091_SCH5140682]|uniref:hypothetical protein n=1 Tax=Mycobacterium sp. 852013-50091_SCH5140682 TaxID=1834109 RepID=UPI0007EB602B|nr:hypothetical protein [Mycobacterium sp. 852013-50091_SCH5140682]OBC05097.1 hypothetical protein A5784_11675 [Mycobacterium sp. 852013-50091_SCH5140682]